MSHEQKTWCGWFLTILALGFSQSSLAQTPVLVCGLEVFPSPQDVVYDDPCENGRTVLGPTDFTNADPPSCEAPQLNGNEVAICHIPKGNPSDAHTAVVGEKAANAHVRRHGDLLAPCDCEDDPTEPVSYNFDTTVTGDICVTVTDSDTSFEIMVNGETLDFAGDSMQTKLFLPAGTHELMGQVIFPANSTITVELRESVPTVVDDQSITTEASGNFRVYNVATDHPLVTPNGDGHHDGTTFTADTEPLITLPGKDDGSIAYFVDWEFVVTNLDDCSVIDTGLSGMKQINSPTNVKVVWDGADTSGTIVGGGNYAYIFHVEVIDEFSVSYGTVDSPAFGMIVDPSPADYTESPELLGACDSATDPQGCKCLSSLPTEDGVCVFAPKFFLFSTKDASMYPHNFLTSIQRMDGRWRVTANLRSLASEGHLVLQHQGEWGSEIELRNWVAELTGVPVSTGDSLFNFDYQQFGTSTAVLSEGQPAPFSFNHFLLDAITDQHGQITVNGVTTDLAAGFAGDVGAPAQYAVSSSRDGEECTHNANSVGDASIGAKLCSSNTAVRIGDVTDLGVYMLRSSIFDVSVDGSATVMDWQCPLSPPAHFLDCGNRTRRVFADVLEVQAAYYADGPSGPEFSHSIGLGDRFIHAYSFTLDRGDGVDSMDGVCTRGVVIENGLRVRMDTVDGSVPDTCVANGIFF